MSWHQSIHQHFKQRIKGRRSRGRRDRRRRRRSAICLATHGSLTPPCSRFKRLCQPLCPPRRPRPRRPSTRARLTAITQPLVRRISSSRKKASPFCAVSCRLSRPRLTPKPLRKLRRRSPKHIRTPPRLPTLLTLCQAVRTPIRRLLPRQTRMALPAPLLLHRSPLRLPRQTRTSSMSTAAA